MVKVLDATPEQKHEFITQFINVVNVDTEKWSFLDFWRAINFALSEGQDVTFTEVVTEEVVVVSELK